MTDDQSIIHKISDMWLELEEEILKQTLLELEDSKKGRVHKLKDKENKDN